MTGHYDVAVVPVGRMENLSSVILSDVIEREPIGKCLARIRKPEPWGLRYDHVLTAGDKGLRVQHSQNPAAGAACCAVWAARFATFIPALQSMRNPDRVQGSPQT